MTLEQIERACYILSLYADKNDKLWIDDDGINVKVKVEDIQTTHMDELKELGCIFYQRIGLVAIPVE